MRIKVGSVKCVSKLIGKHVWDSGIMALGDVYYRTVTYAPLEDCDCYFQFNVLNPYTKPREDRYQAYSQILSSGKPFIVWEEGSFRVAPQYKKIGWDHYQASKGNFNNEEVDSTRWDKFQQNTGISLRPWRSAGPNILIMGQLEGDSALIPLYDTGVKVFGEWVISTIERIRMFTDRPIVYRPHPHDLARAERLIAARPELHSVTISSNYSTENKLNGGRGLAQDLSQAHCVVTFNSNSGVEAACAGIPVFTQTATSPVYNIANTDLSTIEQPDYSIDTTTWCHKMAYTMWTADEVARGETWAHLKPVHFN